MDQRLLFITRHRLCENNGGANASKGFAMCFSAIYDRCSIIYPAFDNTEQVIPRKYELYPYYDRRSKMQKGLDTYRGLASTLSVFARNHLATHSYDVVVIDHSFIGTPSLLNAIKASGAKLITIHHNIERDYLNDNCKEHLLLYRIPYIYFAKKAERDCLAASDVNMAVTENDAKTFRSWYSEKNMHVCNWGIFDYRPLPDIKFNTKAKGVKFVITGSLHFIQSIQPITGFVSRYWPIVNDLFPEATLTIAGRNPNNMLMDACAKQKNIKIIPNPTDMAAVVCQANYYICPIDTGSGLKLRVMDGLKQGMPVLCHDVSAAGYETIAARRCLFCYHDEQSFKEALQKMMTFNVDPDYIYKTFRENFSLDTGINRLKEILQTEHLL